MLALLHFHLTAGYIAAVVEDEGYDYLCSFHEFLHGHVFLPQLLARLGLSL